jgi:adenylate cyclase class 2
MTLEIEVKAYANNLARVEERLKELGAVFIAAVCEKDTYFSHPNRDFAATDEALRIRVADKQSFLTYKGRKIDAKSKTREEIEVALGDADSANLILMRLGFKPVAEVSKIRKRYKIGEFEICLDNVEGVGTFVEVETKGENMGELRDKALAILEKLNLRKTERKSYLELLLKTFS